MRKQASTRNVGGFTIERGVPIPGPTIHRGRRDKYPWRAMQPGESVLIKVNGKSPHAAHSVKGAAVSFGKRHKQVFVAVKMGGGVRVWRSK